MGHLLNVRQVTRPATRVNHEEQVARQHPCLKVDGLIHGHTVEALDLIYSQGTRLSCWPFESELELCRALQPSACHAGVGTFELEHIVTEANCL